jgi:hypothetical protein
MLLADHLTECAGAGPLIDRSHTLILSPET